MKEMKNKNNSKRGVLQKVVSNIFLYIINEW